MFTFLLLKKNREMNIITATKRTEEATESRDSLNKRKAFDAFNDWLVENKRKKEAEVPISDDEPEDETKEIPVLQEKGKVNKTQETKFCGSCKTNSDSDLFMCEHRCSKGCHVHVCYDCMNILKSIMRVQKDVSNRFRNVKSMVQEMEDPIGIICMSCHIHLRKEHDQKLEKEYQEKFKKRGIEIEKNLQEVFGEVLEDNEELTKNSNLEKSETKESEEEEEEGEEKDLCKACTNQIPVSDLTECEHGCSSECKIKRNKLCESCIDFIHQTWDLEIDPDGPMCQECHDAYKDSESKTLV